MTFMDYFRELAAKLSLAFTRLRRGMLGRLIAALFHRIAGNTR